VKTLFNVIKNLKDFFCFRPEVIIDFIFDDGLFYISIKNIGTKPAYKVTTHFDKPLVGVQGKKKVSELPLFQCIEFLPPQKEIKTFLDSSASYFSRNEPELISTQINYRDIRGKKYLNKICHNLEIYKEIGYITKRNS
jgi:hypothetical protein